MYFLSNCFSKPLSSDWGPSVAGTHWRHERYRDFGWGANAGNLGNPEPSDVLSAVFFLKQQDHTQGMLCDLEV